MSSVIDWLFRWPPSIPEYVVTLMLAALLGWSWGARFTERRNRRELDAMMRRIVRPKHLPPDPRTPVGPLG